MQASIQPPMETSRDIVIGSIVDMAGVARAKVVPRARLRTFTRSGVGAAPSWNVFCVDDNIAFSPSFSVAGDLRLKVKETDLRKLGGGVLWAPAGFFEQSGTPAAVCTRNALIRTEEKLADNGFEAAVGHEIEFMLFGASEPEEWSAYGLAAISTREAFIQDLLEAATLAELHLEQVHAEYGLNQFEISLAPAEPVRAADDAVLARMLISRTARSHGLRASFSPVPAAGSSGNGAHQHISFSQGGVPLLSGGTGPYGLTADGGHAIAGLLTGLADFMAVFASSPLSHLRLKPGMWSGAYCCWGLENREAALRFCAATMGNPHGANLEVKVLDPSANPYLSSTAILGLALAGIEEEKRLPEEVTVNPAELSEAARSKAGVALLPSQVPDMLGRLHRSELASALFGESILEALTAVKDYEYQRFKDEPVERTAERLRFAWSG